MILQKTKGLCLSRTTSTKLKSSPLKMDTLLKRIQEILGEHTKRLTSKVVILRVTH